MSSWKKASKTGQKFHKERAQVKDREHLGLLEKKKDYKLRALDYQKKRDVIVNLKRKALEKNPDEFYFNMTRTEMKDGSHQLRNPYKDYTEDEIKLMKSQDKNYIKFKHQIELKKIEKLKNSMHLIDVEDMPLNQHRFFVEDHEQARKFNPVEQFNTHEALLGRKSNRLTKEQLENLNLPDWIDDEYVKEMNKSRSKKYKELADRVKRFESLKKLDQTYDLKTTKLDPEQEYDEKYSQNYSNETKANTSIGINYTKIVPRKR
ncbi:unnamed protein product [Brachionus calyciflorus]|uniref:U3 small nucleolar RNA-associated protein 11 n=1 Tax=Brachionus calyciflorus TaxID=104777 RepID=A0A813M3N4_9BILA|nr:unnamed protein product [Brachionus calyciflorus]